MLNTLAARELNALPNNASWPASLGGGLVQTPAGVILSGDIIDNGDTEAFEIANFTHVYGLNGSDGLLNFPLYEGRGNHDGANTTQDGNVALMIVERNVVRKASPLFHITNVSETGLHYSWAWPVSAGCTAHFIMLNEYAGHLCDGCSPAPSCFYGPACYAGWTFPEDSLGFLEATLSNTVGSSNAPVFVIQHYCFDGYSNTWWSQNQRSELFATLSKYNAAGIICGHTHSAA